MFRRRRAGMAALLTAALIGVLGACGGSDDWGDSQGSSQAPDVSEEGQVEYACALGHHVQDEHGDVDSWRSEEHTSELQSRGHLVCRLLLEKKKKIEEQIRSVQSITYTSY